jgi:hypothetical protein
LCTPLLHWTIATEPTGDENEQKAPTISVIPKSNPQAFNTSLEHYYNEGCGLKDQIGFYARDAQDYRCCKNQTLANPYTASGVFGTEQFRNYNTLQGLGYECRAKIVKDNPDDDLDVLMVRLLGHVTKICNASNQ